MNNPYIPTRRTTAQWQETDAAHHLHPFTDTQALNAKGARVIIRGSGIYIEDNDGKRYLDAMSGLWCVNLGHGQEALIEAAYRQLQDLPYYNCFFQTTTTPAAELGEVLAGIAPPGFRHVFYTNSGSEANDTNIKLVRRYWDLLGQPERRIIISRRNAYHGSTIAAGSLGGMSYMHDQAGTLPGIAHIDQPYWFEHGQGMDKDQFGLVAAAWLEQKILEVGPDKVAAFIGEPIQGAGGVIIPPRTYWPEIQRICDKYGILLISDEVVCGFGRTGRMWGCQSVGSRPDLITFAKGVTSGYVPLGGVLVGERVARVLIEKGGDFNHGYTYSGHPVACAVAIANIGLLEYLDVVRSVREDLAPRLAKHFAELAQHPLVGEAETFGMMGALHLLKDKASGATFAADEEIGMLCRGICFDNGLVMRAVGDRMIIAPPLVMTPPQIDQLAALIRSCLDLTHEQAIAKGWMPEQSGRL